MGGELKIELDLGLTKIVAGDLADAPQRSTLRSAESRARTAPS